MLVQIITIGDELLIGQVVDTNSAWMAESLNHIGAEVIRIVSVRDRHDEILQAIDEAMGVADVVLLTGGLGPTKDDITKQALCDYFNTKLVFDEGVFENVKHILSGRVPINQLNKDQALVPEACTVINNRVGTASVSWFEKDDRILVSMPGVPQEMKVVMAEEVLPRLRARSGVEAVVHRTFWVRNYPESVLAETLEVWESQLPDTIRLAYLPNAGIIRLRMTARGEEAVVVNQMRDEAVKLYSILGRDIIAEGETSLEKLLGDALRQHGMTVSTAESCTGGNVAARITSIAGSSDYFKGAIVAYANEVKMNLLQVSPHVLDEFGAVSEEVVVAMVKGVMNALGTDCAMAISGVAGPGGGTVEKPVGTVWIAAACGSEIRTFKQAFDRGREVNIERACNNALLLLLELLH